MLFRELGYGECGTVARSAKPYVTAAFSLHKVGDIKPFLPAARARFCQNRFCGMYSLWDNMGESGTAALRGSSG